MKKYEIPQIEIVAIKSEDVLTSSGETFIEWPWEDDVFDD